MATKKRSPNAKLPVVQDRCTGQCCTAFTLPYSPDEMKAKYEAWIRKPADQLRMSQDETLLQGRESVPEDVHLVYPMLVHLGEHVTSPVRGISMLNKWKHSDRPTHWYTCKHFDKGTKNCTIYDHRPQMCREYPYGNKCEYKGCSWSEHAAKKEPKPKHMKLKSDNYDGLGLISKRKA